MIDQKLNSIRSKGWMVAIHNDYTLDGQFYTFWLFVKGEKAIRGEGRTDNEALDIAIIKMDI